MWGLGSKNLARGDRIVWFPTESSLEKEKSTNFLEQTGGKKWLKTPWLQLSRYQGSFQKIGT